MWLPQLLRARRFTTELSLKSSPRAPTPVPHLPPLSGGGEALCLPASPTHSPLTPCIVHSHALHLDTPPTAHTHCQKCHNSSQRKKTVLFRKELFVPISLQTQLWRHKQTHKLLRRVHPGFRLLPLGGSYAYGQKRGRQSGEKEARRRKISINSKKVQRAEVLYIVALTSRRTSQEGEV